VWVYPCSGATIHPFSGAGVAGTPIARPGEVANDVDVEVAGAAFTLGTTTLAAGDVVFINGETATAELYTPQAGTAVALATAYGADHVVGAALHPMRGTVFAVQDRVAGNVGNVIAELDATTGAVLASFSVLPAFSVNYGDLEVCRSNGYLFVVSSDEPTLAVFTPTGTLVDEYPLPAEVASGASGIGLDDAAGAAWISSTNGNLVRIAGLPCQ
jgi:outer membrane protein assembly factor BamB